jgi:hypothetical protein
MFCSEVTLMTTPENMLSDNAGDCQENAMAICENHGHPHASTREFLLNFLPYYEFVQNGTFRLVAISM